MDKTELKCLAALYGNGQPPTKAEVEEVLRERSESEREVVHQRKLHRWLLAYGIPHFHPPNEGERTEAQTIALKAQGMSNGVPDMVITVARKPYFGLFLELKRKESGVVTGAQEYWLKTLNREGYRAVISYSLEESQKIILEYMEGESWTLIPPG